MGEVKKLNVIVTGTIRGIVRQANEENIKKEDIVTILKDRDQFILIYYK